MTTEKSAKKVPPNAKKKGGTMFPRFALNEADGYAKKLVAKTHTGAQPESIILPGVFGAGSSRGQVRASGLKQYGLMTGKSTAYEATQLAKDLVAAPPDERPALLQKALLAPKVFRTLWETYRGDTVSIAKLRQQASQSGVHPDEAENCARLFVESAKFAGLATLNGENVSLLQQQAEASSPATADGEGEVRDDGEDLDETEASADDDSESESDASDDRSGGAAVTARSVIHVNVTLDSSLDTEKLERQLALLRRYGAL